jgi:hypothetical protein
MTCPCEKCLVRVTCGNTLIRILNTRRYLVVEYAEKCPYIIEYFGFGRDGRIDHSYEKIFKLCEIFKATDGRYFIWFYNEL